MLLEVCLLYLSHVVQSLIDDKIQVKWKFSAGKISRDTSCGKDVSFAVVVFCSRTEYSLSKMVYDKFPTLEAKTLMMVLFFLCCSHGCCCALVLALYLLYGDTQWMLSHALELSSLYFTFFCEVYLRTLVTDKPWAF